VLIAYSVGLCSTPRAAETKTSLSTQPPTLPQQHAFRGAVRCRNVLEDGRSVERVRAVHSNNTCRDQAVKYLDQAVQYLDKTVQQVRAVLNIHVHVREELAQAHKDLVEVPQDVAPRHLHQIKTQHNIDMNTAGHGLFKLTSLQSRGTSSPINRVARWKQSKRTARVTGEETREKVRQAKHAGKLSHDASHHCCHHHGVPVHTRGNIAWDLREAYAPPPCSLADAVPCISTRAGFSMLFTISKLCSSSESRGEAGQKIKRVAGHGVKVIPMKFDYFDEATRQEHGTHL